MKQGSPKKFWNRQRKEGSRDRGGERSLHATPASGSLGLRQLINGPIRFVRGLQKWYVALKFQLFRLSGGLLGRGRFPWLKLGMLVLALFFLFKKDLQFTINLGKLKHSAAAHRELAQDDNKVEEMGVGTALTSVKKSASPDIASVGSLDPEDVRNYIDRFQEVARMEMKKYLIPASIKLAQGIAESQAGMSREATESNNHFGDAMQVMAYNTAWENWRAHSVLLQRSYPELFEGSTSYEAWAKGLKKAGYSKDRKYDRKLIEIIEAYDLARFDR